MHLSIQIVIIKWYTLVLTVILLSALPPLPYQRLVCNYKKADSASITKPLDLVNREKLFDRMDINAQVSILKEAILNIFQTMYLVSISQLMIKILATNNNNE